MLKRLSLLIFSFLITQANAATFNISCGADIEIASSSCSIHLSGALERGDNEKLRAILSSRLNPGLSYLTLSLDSPGGSVEEAMAIASSVRQGILKTTTTKFNRRNYGDRRIEQLRCVSACFLIWVAGAERFAYTATAKGGDWHGIGLHRPYFESNTYQQSPQAVADAQKKITREVREYLINEQVPLAYIQQMLQRSSREIYWLTENGDGFLLNGRAPWFEEMMIARCGFDPVYDRDSEKFIVRQSPNGQSANVRAAIEKYFQWRQNYNVCEYSIRRAAQHSFQR